MERVARIIEADAAPCLAVVLSAARGVTDALLGLVAAAERHEDVSEGLEAVRVRHAEMAAAMCEPSSAAAYIAELDAECLDIASILHAVRLTGSASTNT